MARKRRAKALNKKYRLHALVKKVAKVDARRRTVFVTEELLSSMNNEQRIYIDVLKDQYGYNIQFEIA